MSEVNELSFQLQKLSHKKESKYKATVQRRLSRPPAWFFEKISETDLW